MAGTGAAPAALYLGLCRLRGILSPPAPHDYAAGGAIHRCSNDGAASIRKSGPEIKNRCTQQGINRQNPASILKFGPEIKNHCTLEGVPEQKLAAIPKFTP